MKLSRSRRQLWLGIVLLILLVGAWMNIVNDRCSKNVTEDETAGMVQAVPFAGGRK
jgi:hypothetical protein